MSSRFRVRFRPALQIAADNTDVPLSLRQGQTAKQPPRSRSGCKDCKRRRVKCDETFPVCLRCQKRGTICESMNNPLPQWHLEILSMLPSGFQPSSPEQMRLLQYWCERASQIMVFNPEFNPFSFPIFEHFESSPSLLHTILSISAAHEHFFKQESLQTCLGERSQALALLRNELDEPLPSTFLSIFMLGISTPWIDSTQAQFGYEHLNGAQTLIDLILSSSAVTDKSFGQFILGSYLYWDMACSFLIEPGQPTALSSHSISSALKEAAGSFHPIMGYSIEMMYLLGNLGRHCRFVCDFGIRDITLEREFEAQLLAWKPACEDFETFLLGKSFRNHGLINLYRICGRPNDRAQDGSEDVLDEGDLASNVDTENIIRQYSIQTVRDLDRIPTSNWHTNMHAIPLLTAGSELPVENTEERALVMQRFNALYSINRIPGNLMAMDILQQVWEARDLGITVSWLHVMLNRGWRLSLG